MPAPRSKSERTWGQALLQLVGLVGILQDESVDEALAADLELDLLGLAVTLDPGGCVALELVHCPLRSADWLSFIPSRSIWTYKRHPSGGRSR